MAEQYKIDTKISNHEYKIDKKGNVCLVLNNFEFIVKATFGKKLHLLQEQLYLLFCMKSLYVDFKLYKLKTVVNKTTATY